MSRLQTGALLLGLVGAALLLIRLQELVIVLAIGIVLGEGLWPAIDSLRRKGIPIGVAAGLVYGGLFAALVVVLVLMARPLVAEARLALQDLPLYQLQFQRNFGQLLNRLSIDSDVAPQVGASLEGIVRAALSLVVMVGRGVIDAVAAGLISLFWIFTRQPAGRFASSLLAPAQRPRAAELWAEIARGLAGYVRGVAINMVVIGVVTGIAAALLGLPAPALLGLVAGLTEMVPIVGPVLGATPAVLLGFTVSPYHPILVALVYLVIQQLEAHTLVPLVMRHSVGLPALVVVVALATGAALGGVGGAIVAVPVAVAGRVIVLRVVAPWIRSHHEHASATTSPTRREPSSISADRRSRATRDRQPV
jgi:predicted PurR-regulated permease PerM